MGLDDDDDDASLRSVIVKKRPRVDAMVTMATAISTTSSIFSIPSSSDDDDDDDDDIATLRPSQSFAVDGDIRLHNDDDADDATTLEQLHETQEGGGGGVPPVLSATTTPWSPLTASPLTPHYHHSRMMSSSTNKKSSSSSSSSSHNKNTVSSLTVADRNRGQPPPPLLLLPPVAATASSQSPCEDRTAKFVSNARPGLNIRKVRPNCDDKKGIPAVNNTNTNTVGNDGTIPRVSLPSEAEERVANPNNGGTRTIVAPSHTATQSPVPPASNSRKRKTTNMSGNNNTTTNTTTTKSVLEVAATTKESPTTEHVVKTKTSKKQKTSSVSKNKVVLESDDRPSRPLDEKKKSAKQRKISKDTTTTNNQASTITTDDETQQQTKKETDHNHTNISLNKNPLQTIVDPSNNIDIPTKKRKATESIPPKHKHNKESTGTDTDTSEAVPNVGVNQHKRGTILIDDGSPTTVHATTKVDTKKKPSTKTTVVSTDGSVKASTSQKGAKKPKKLTFQEQVMVHMLNAFKPFTLKVLSDELKTSETSVNFVLLSLVDKGLVVPKEFTAGKNGRIKTLYWANHNGKAKEVNVTGSGDNCNAVASSTDREMAHRRLISVRNEIATIRNHHQQLLQTPSNDDLIVLITKQEMELQELYHRRDDVQQRIRSGLSTGTSGGGVPMKTAAHRPVATKKERPCCPMGYKKRINQLREEWKQRKTKCMDFVEQLSDGLEKSPKQVLTLCDIDTDEMNQVVVPSKYLIP